MPEVEEEFEGLTWEDYENFLTHESNYPHHIFLNGEKILTQEMDLEQAIHWLSEETQVQDVEYDERRTEDDVGDYHYALSMEISQDWPSSSNDGGLEYVRNFRPKDVELEIIGWRDEESEKLNKPS